MVFLPLHLTPPPVPTTTVRVGTSSQVYTAFAACPFPPPPSDSPYFQAPSFLMLPTATASNCFFHLHSRFPTRHCLQSPRRFKSVNQIMRCLPKTLNDLPVVLLSDPSSGTVPRQAENFREKGAGASFTSRVEQTRARCLLYFLVFVHRCILDK